MPRKWFILPAFFLLGLAAYTQSNPADTAIKAPPELTPDTTIDYDELFRDFDSFMDSILSPHSYFLASISAGKGYYNFAAKNSFDVQTEQKLTYSPILGYYHKSGLGLTATGYVVNDQDKMNFFQVGVSPSFDFLQNRAFATGIAYTRYITKKDLSFYTTPLQNELYAYFTYRKSWLRPTVAVSYGWGSRSDYSEREEQIQALRLRLRGFTYVNTEESVSDFSVLASLRHDFYWLDVFANNDHIRFTPQLSFTSGTQKFGFNQSSGTYATIVRTGNTVLFNSENVYLDDRLDFQPLSLTLYLRSEYSIGRFFLQPQLMMDYYFPAPSNNFNLLFSLSTGFMF